MPALHAKTPSRGLNAAAEKALPNSAEALNLRQFVVLKVVNDLKRIRALPSFLLQCPRLCARVSRSVLCTIMLGVHEPSERLKCSALFARVVRDPILGVNIFSACAWVRHIVIVRLPSSRKRGHDHTRGGHSRAECCERSLPHNDGSTRGSDAFCGEPLF